jgi:type I restriction enzyme M protein
MVECVRPEPGKTIADPCCGSGGFFLAAQSFLSNPENYTLDRSQKEFLKNETFHGNEIVGATFKTALMNLYLHNIGDIYGEIPITLGDALLSDPGYRVDYVLTIIRHSVKSPLSPLPMRMTSRRRKTSYITDRISGLPARISS